MPEIQLRRYAGKLGAYPSAIAMRGSNTMMGSPPAERKTLSIAPQDMTALVCSHNAYVEAEWDDQGPDLHLNITRGSGVRPGEQDR